MDRNEFENSLSFRLALTIKAVSNNAHIHDVLLTEFDPELNFEHQTPYMNFTAAFSAANTETGDTPGCLSADEIRDLRDNFLDWLYAKYRGDAIGMVEALIHNASNVAANTDQPVILAEQKPRNDLWYPDPLDEKEQKAIKSTPADVTLDELIVLLRAVRAKHGNMVVLHEADMGGDYGTGWFPPKVNVETSPRQNDVTPDALKELTLTIR